MNEETTPPVFDQATADCVLLSPDGTTVTRSHYDHWIWTLGPRGEKIWADQVRCGTCGRVKYLMRNDL